MLILIPDLRASTAVWVRPRVGAAPDTGTFWNGITASSAVASFSASNLENSTNTAATGINLSFAAGSGGQLNAYDTGGSMDASFAPALLNDFTWLGGTVGTTTASFTFSNLTAGHTYDLYIYGENGGYNSQANTYTVGSQNLSFANNATGDAAFTAGVNYVEFTNLSPDGSGDIVGTWLANPTNAGVNGFQLVDTTPVVEAPEPSTVALIGLGSLGLAFLIRRHRTA